MILLTSIGGMLEFYDFVIFGMFVSCVLGKTFFPREGSPALQAYFFAFTVFAVGYFARLFGGIFGHISDKYGHKKSVLLTITLVDGPSCFYDSYIAFISKRWYSFAILLFIVLRIIQGGYNWW